MHQLRVGFLVLVLLIGSGCAWQRIPAAPEYSVPAPFPIRVGVVLADTQPTGIYGPGIVGLWKEMRVFEGITYPYREGDQVDGVIIGDLKRGTSEVARYSAHVETTVE